MAEKIALPDPAKSINGCFSLSSVDKIVWGCYGLYEMCAELPYSLWPIDCCETCNTSITNKMRYIRISGQTIVNINWSEGTLRLLTFAKVQC